MVTVELQSLLPTPKGLVCGLVIRYGKNGPVRFAKAQMPWGALTWHVREEIMHQLGRLDEREPEQDDPLF